MNLLYENIDDLVIKYNKTRKIVKENKKFFEHDFFSIKRQINKF